MIDLMGLGVSALPMFNASIHFRKHDTVYSSQCWVKLTTHCTQDVVPILV